MSDLPAARTRRAFLSCVAAPAILAGAQRAKRRNVILILTDDQGYGDLGCHGNSQIKTPNLDRLYSESTRFTNFYSSPLCSPTRASLLTGRYSYRTGIVDTWVGLAQMRPAEITIAEVFRDAGYRTALFGKWHLGDNYPMRPHDQGFEETLFHTDGAIGALGDPGPNTYFDPVLFRNDRPEQTKGYCTNVFFDAALDFLKRRERENFFLYLPTNVPHGPLQVADNYAAPYRKLGLAEDTARVYGMVENLDENVGRLLSYLKTSGLDKDTIVIFMSDNGPWGSIRYNAGLRDQKGTVYDGGIKVPFFLRAPGLAKAGVDIDRIAAHIDVMPTLLDACGISAPPQVRFDGRSLMPLVKDAEAAWPDRTLFFQQSRPDPAGLDEARLFTHCAARSQRYKIVMSTPDPRKRYTEATPVEQTELYDIEKDPGETTNLAAGQPQLVVKMRAEYEAWFRDVMTGVDPPVRVHLGAAKANPVLLTPQDLRGPRAPAAPWNYDRAKAYWKTEPDGFGYWEVDVQSKGHYTFIARFGTAETKVPMKAGAARLAIGTTSQSQKLVGGEEAVTFTLPLQPGPLRLEIALEGQRRDAKPVSPFFVEVKYSGR